MAGVVAAATGLQFATIDLVGSKLAGTAIIAKKTLTVGAIAASTGGLIFAAVL